MLNPTWTIAVLSNGLTDWNEALLRFLPVEQAQIIVLTSKPQSELKKVLPEGAELITVGSTDEWHPAAAFYALKERVKGDYLLFLHDDVLISSDTTLSISDLWRFVLEGLERPFRYDFVGMVAPHLEEDCLNSDQAFVQYGLPFGAWFNTAKPLESCAFAVRTEFLNRYDLSWSYLYDYYQIEMQAELLTEGYQIAIQPGVVFYHKGFSAQASQALNPKNQEGYQSALRAHDYRVLATKLGWTLLPCQPIIFSPLVGNEVEYSLCEIEISLDARIVRAQHCVATTYELAAKSKRLRQGRIWAGLSPNLQEAVNLVCGKQVIIPEGNSYSQAYPLLKLGETQSIVPLMKEVHLSAYRLAGLGDTMMFTAAIRAFHERYPSLEIHLYISNWFEIWQNGFDYLRVHDYREGVPNASIDLCVNNGREGTPQGAFEALSIGDYPLEQRKMNYLVTAQENDKANDTLYRKMKCFNRPVIGLQAHGGWPSKAWAQMECFAFEAAQSGYTVLLFGQRKNEDNPHHQKRDYKLCAIDVPAIKGENIYDLIGQTNNLRELAAMINQCNAWVGFDSGPSYLANAIGIPSVLLYGTHDPQGLIGECGANMPYKAIWRRWPFNHPDCECRGTKENSDLGTGGQSCTRRIASEAGIRVGSACLDDISAWEVLNAVKELLNGA